MEQVGASYLLVLEDLGSDELKAAAAHYLSTGRFFPTPGDLRSAAMDLHRISFGIPAPLEAWAQVQSALHHLPGVACEEGQRLLDACAARPIALTTMPSTRTERTRRRARSARPAGIAKSTATSWSSARCDSWAGARH